MRYIRIRILDETHRELRRIAYEYDISLQRVVADALTIYVETVKETTKKSGITFVIVIVTAVTQSWLRLTF